MISLKIKEAGHTIAIPGLPVCRSPVNLDISKLDIRIISMYLKTSGITKYEIIAETERGDREVYTRKDFDIVEKQKSKIDKQDINNRFNRIEKMMEILLTREVSKITPNEEQITNKLDNLEKLLRVNKNIQVVNKTEARKNILNDDPDIEEIDSFIPEVDISDMKLSSDNIKTVKQDDGGLEDAADILSGLIRRG